MLILTQLQIFLVYSDQLVLNKFLLLLSPVPNSEVSEAEKREQ